MHRTIVGEVAWEELDELGWAGMVERLTDEQVDRLRHVVSAVHWGRVNARKRAERRAREAEFVGPPAPAAYPLSVYEDRLEEGLRRALERSGEGAVRFRELRRELKMSGQKFAHALASLLDKERVLAKQVRSVTGGPPVTWLGLP